MLLSSSMVEHSAVNRRVVGSNPTWGAKVSYCNHWLFPSSLRTADDSFVTTSVTILDFPSKYRANFCPAI